MTSAAVDTADVLNNTTGSLVETKVAESTSKPVEEEKRKLTKEEKKLRHSVFEEPLATRRDLLKDLLAPNDKTPRDPETEKECAELAESALCQAFGEATNPYKDAFDIYEVFSDNKEKYKRVHKILFKTFEAWIEKCGTPEKIEGWLTNEFKKETMEKIVKKGTVQLDNLLRIFHLKGADVTELVSEKIKDLCSDSKQQFREAMKLAGHFDLHDNFKIHDFVIPQMLQNRQEDVEKYLKGHYEETKQLIRFLDNMVDESDQFKLAQVQSYIDRKIVSNTSAFEFITRKIPGLLKRMVSPDFGMDDSVAPKYDAQKIKNKLRYLIFDRESTGGCFSNTIFDHVKTHIKKNSPMAKDVIIALFDRIDRPDKHEDKQTYYTEAEMWMLYYGLNPSDFFSRIRNYFASNPGWKDRATKMLEEYNAVATINDYRLEDGTLIEWIDNWDGLVKMLSEIEGLGKDSVIGIDSEFRSTTNYKQEIALLQVSSVHQVYLVDFETLMNHLSPLQWREFTRRLFGGEHIKIGFDMLSDIKAYLCTMEFVGEELQSMTRVICLKRLSNDLLDADPSLFDLAQSTSYKNRIQEGKAAPEVESANRQRAIKLSDLVEVVLKTELDKSLQKSNWSMRPLRPEQIVYAALDANILIKVYLKLGELAREKGFDYEEMVRSIENDLEERKMDKTEKKKKTRMSEEEYALLVESINAAVISANSCPNTPKAFITDSSFGGLGKHLRRLGVDVIFAESKDHLLRLGKENPSRIILSFGKNIEEYKATFGNRVFIVGIGLSAKDQVKRVLTEFKIKLNPADVFTRCMACNGDRFVMIPSIVLQTLHDCAKRVGETFDDETFQPDQFKETIENANPDDYGGFECSVEEYDLEESRFIIKCTNGVVDVFNNLVMVDTMDTTVEVQTLKVQPEVVDSDRPFYYICGGCGKIYWDGTHGKRYKEFATGVVGSEASTSEESATKE
ncbi:hypothetical protein PMAYCL1PPCAC_06583 [Pristionchus mayeri]|uniref:3'-5' exonuclease domain-containing protein n=1 Tax=Pristionchus mayeri TaxID=1317129 RepID=A0AAN4ZD91_9BILA|nr:hypothetical protein PMAYCL1PPCAC_06583 [Pristionchus mayeri]